MPTDDQIACLENEVRRLNTALTDAYEQLAEVEEKLTAEVLARADLQRRLSNRPTRDRVSKRHLDRGGIRSVRIRSAW